MSSFILYRHTSGSYGIRYINDDTPPETFFGYIQHAPGTGYRHLQIVTALPDDMELLHEAPLIVVDRLMQFAVYDFEVDPPGIAIYANRFHSTEYIGTYDEVNHDPFLIKAIEQNCEDRSVASLTICMPDGAKARLAGKVAAIAFVEDWRKRRKQEL